MKNQKKFSGLVLDERHGKTAGLNRGLDKPPPSMKKNPNRERRREAERRYTSLKVSYLRELHSLVNLSVREESPGWRSLRRNFRGVIHSHYSEAYRLGMIAQAAGITTSESPLLSQQQQKWLDGAIETELSYFVKMIRSIQSGRVSTPDIERRLGHYSESLDAIYTSGRVTSSPEDTIFNWRIGKTDASCRGCVYLSKRGPYTVANLPCVPRDGTTRCLGNCLCKLVMKRVSTEEFKRVERAGLSRGVLLRQLRRNSS